MLPSRSHHLPRARGRIVSTPQLNPAALLQPLATRRDGYEAQLAVLVRHFADELAGYADAIEQGVLPARLLQVDAPALTPTAAAIERICLELHLLAATGVSRKPGGP